MWTQFGCGNLVLGMPSGDKIAAGDNKTVLNTLTLAGELCVLNERVEVSQSLAAVLLAFNLSLMPLCWAAT